MRIPGTLQLFLLFLLLLPASGRNVVVVGSDFLPEALGDALETFAAGRSDRIKVEFKGSAAGVETFEDGLATLVLFANGSENPPPYQFRFVPLARVTCYVAVNADNPLESISYENLNGIFAAGSDRATLRWSDLGLSGEWLNRTINIAAPNEYDFLTLPLFRARVMPNQELRSSVATAKTTAEIEGLLASDPTVIGLLPKPPENPRIKLVPVSRRGDNFPFSPTSENINFGDYPIQLQVYIGLPVIYEPSAYEYAAFLLSDRVSEILEAGGFVPMLPATRVRVREELFGEKSP